MSSNLKSGWLWFALAAIVLLAVMVVCGEAGYLRQIMDAVWDLLTLPPRLEL